MHGVRDQEEDSSRERALHTIRQRSASPIRDMGLPLRVWRLRRHLRGRLQGHQAVTLGRGRRPGGVVELVFPAAARSGD